MRLQPPLAVLGRWASRPLAQMKVARARGLRTELVLLIFTAIVPLVAFSVGAILWGAWLQQRSVEDGLENTASALSFAVSSELGSWKAGLRAIALSSELEVGDYEQLHRRVTPLARSMGGWMVLFAPDGTQVMNTLVPYGTPLRPASSMREIARVVSTQESTASDLFVGANAAREIVVVYEPVIVGGVVKYVLGLGMEPQRLSALLAVQPLPPGWFSFLTDGSDRVIARSVGGSQAAGKSGPEWFVARQGRRSGVLHGEANGSGEVLAAYQGLRDAPWTISVAVPQTLIERERTLALLLLGAGAFVLLALAVWLSGRVAARIAAPVRALALAAEHGFRPANLPARSVYELQELERALVRAADVERERGAEREQRLALEAASKAKDEFLATLSHELRTPLQAALGWLYVLRMSVDDAARNRAVPVIERNLHQLGQLVDDLIDASRIVSGKVALQLTPHELAPLVRQTVETWQPAVVAKDQQLVVEVEEGVWVQCDRARMAQVLSNLIANSVKFTPRGGRIDVRLTSSEDRVQLVVADSGDGIAPEALPNIFNKFWQVQGGTERRYQGLGLGLAIVKSLVELQGGRATATSAGLGQGATFTVSLPRIDAPSVVAAVERTEDTQATLAGTQVLLVDDDVDAGSAIAQLLLLAGAEVTLVHSVADALHALHRLRFDVALSDIAMPEQDGFDLLRAVRRQRPELPVVALTAFAADRDRERILAAGFNGFVSKPVSIGRLHQAIRELVPATLESGAAQAQALQPRTAEGAH